MYVFFLGGKGGTPLRHGHKERYKDLNLKISTSEWDSQPRPHELHEPPVRRSTNWAIRRSGEASLGIPSCILCFTKFNHLYLGTGCVCVFCVRACVFLPMCVCACALIQWPNQKISCMYWGKHQVSTISPPRWPASHKMSPSKNAEMFVCRLDMDNWLHTTYHEPLVNSSGKLHNRQRNCRPVVTQGNAMVLCYMYCHWWPITYVH